MDTGMMRWTAAGFARERSSWSDAPEAVREQLVVTGPSATKHVSGRMDVTEQDLVVASLCPSAEDAHHNLRWKVDNGLGEFDGRREDTIADLLAEYEVDLPRDGEQDLVLFVSESYDVCGERLSHDGIQIAPPEAVARYVGLSRGRHDNWAIEEGSSLRRFLDRYASDDWEDELIPE